MSNENLAPFFELGKKLRQKDFVERTFGEAISLQQQLLPWYLPTFVEEAITNIANALVEEQLQAFANYNKPSAPKTIGVVPSGVTPLENFYDLFYVLAAGHNYSCKPAPGDKTLLSIMAELLIEIEPSWRERIRFSQSLGRPDAIILDTMADQGDVLHQYLHKFKHILRHSTSSVAILTGDESEQQLQALARDIHLFFGRGERGVAKLYVPCNYDFVPLLHAIHDSSTVIADNNYYLNHLDYQKSIRLMNKLFYMDSGTFLLLESSDLNPALSIVNYQYYGDLTVVTDDIGRNCENIQHVMSEEVLPNINTLPFGTSHIHPLTDYTSNINVFEFLNQLN
ncbi:MAG: hypothetical protein MJZ39_04075 [Bacteroidales bacterium]|nr:hypothetical protein [Bacteroidales bacterium]